MNSNKRVAFYTLGCKVNHYETESIKNKLLKEGYEEVQFDEEADFYIVNSCTVTSVADRKTRNILRRTKKLNKSAKVIVTGCYAQTNEKDLLKIEEVDYVVGNSNKGEVAEIILNIDKNEEQHNYVLNIFDDSKYRELQFSTFREMSRAYIKIQDGCNNFCSYCKIPFGRGKSRSREFENIILEANKLSEEGYKEIILIGINLGDYGKDLKEDVDFEDLLEALVKINGIERIRIGSVYPDRITDRFIEIMKNNKKMMPHLHISLQSCDDEILKKMKRNYGSNLIKERLTKLKENIKYMEYTADVIVGFPGETDKMYQNTKEIIEEIGFSSLHVFPYSERENTLAATYKDKVDSKEKKLRVGDLEKESKRLGEDIRNKYIGKKLTVLIEEKKSDGFFYGYSENYLRVKLLGDNLKVNDEVQVIIKGLEKGLLISGY
ncbi:tRNA (N(6)-L-threonylcarbamoyladenosine(37)-C(2))-methylthiotransferase MtaB [Fusobacterium sp. IOR10]|uniref:tRNA (N(6)-L-threonylcarbamoyladenosine(37)-C(2))- methylthiotransferase MtaB n=1 Tax=Fusobacterium sp. IOR10 TaxID=2665157 RepID=UPI0013D0A78D|nr:tRNA (N(6)-L-threonylcarbamoyladenosine(37)-C(2))-methylthiotransferase MtaB [Fusobacterium sp. IOR10]